MCWLVIFPNGIKVNALWNLVSTGKTIRTSNVNQEQEVGSLFWNIGGFLPIASWRATLEINGRNNQWDNGNENEIFLTPGVIYKLSKAWEVGLGTPVGLTNMSDDCRVFGYLMWELEFGQKHNEHSVKFD